MARGYQLISEYNNVGDETGVHNYTKITMIIRSFMQVTMH